MSPQRKSAPWKAWQAGITSMRLVRYFPKNTSIEGRSARPAQDSFNAFLNYGYGILYTKIERVLMLAGLHPHIGFMHADGYQRKNLVFDFIEPFRVWIDKLVFKLFTRKQVTALHVGLKEGQDLWLAEDGKRLMAAEVKARFKVKKQPIGNNWFPLDGFLLETAKRTASLILHGKILEDIALAA